MHIVMAPKTILEIAQRERRHFGGLIQTYESGITRGIRINECKGYYLLWNSIISQGGQNLTQAQQNELDDAVSSGEYDDLLGVQ
jgi:hypothetical protein